MTATQSDTKSGAKQLPYLINDADEHSTPSTSAYERYIDPEKQEVGKQHLQISESKHSKLRTRSKRLVRRSLCFAKTTTMHDLGTGLFINCYELGLPL